MKFKDLAIGDKFTYGGIKYTKQSDRTASYQFYIWTLTEFIAQEQRVKP